MSNEFDLERAKAGEPVEFRGNNGEWMGVHFVGPSSVTGSEVVIEIDRYVRYAPKSLLRMAPKKVKVRYRVAVMKKPNGEFGVSHIRDVAFEEEMEADWRFAQWAADWQEVEITE